MAFDSKTFLTRTASAAVFVVLLLGCVWFSYSSFVLFFTIVGLIGIYEFNNLSEHAGKTPNKFPAYILHLVFITAVFFIYKIDLHLLKPYLLIAILAFPLYFIVELFKEKRSIFNIPVFLLTFSYVTVPIVCLLFISGIHKILDNETFFTPQKVLGIIFFIWTNDTGAYLVGSFLGKHKLYEKISPGKTWEGTIGGVVLCIALSFVIAKIFPQLPQIHWVIISIIVAVFGSLGDLVESMLKRMAGVKDSGKIMPGHGGVLDRFDSLFFSTPFVFCYLAATGNL